MINRLLKFSKTRSFFIFGPRQTGKSTLVKAYLQETDLYINLLPERIYLGYAREPGRFRQEILAHAKQHPESVCVVDEIQKLPALLDEVHDLIENTSLRFILTGSSARKLKRGAANLLAGRANTYHLFTLTLDELGDDFDLERALLLGLLPYLWSRERSAQDQIEFLKAYSETYLREEIQSEGIVRKIAPFAHFLDVTAINDGELVNYTNIARECGVSTKTAQEYYQILEDSFLAYRLNPWIKSLRKRLTAHPKYYFFDTGVTNALCHYSGQLNRDIRGRRFEQMLVTQLMAYNSYLDLNLEFYFWRTHTGSEIDLLIARNNQILAAAEIKSTEIIPSTSLHALKEFSEEYPKAGLYIVSTTERTRILNNNIEVVPWKEFLEKVKKL